jgi:hypothetical protein
MVAAAARPPIGSRFSMGLFEPNQMKASALAFRDVMCDQLRTDGGWQAGETYITGAISRLKRASQKLQVRLKDDENELTELARLVRSLNAHIVSLSGNVQALKLSQGEDGFALSCAGTMSWLHANLQALETCGP